MGIIGKRRRLATTFVLDVHFDHIPDIIQG
jgi:hypothetical protein